MNSNPDRMEIYIHIPFCARKCAYCDFLSFPAGREIQRGYTDALLEEIRRFPEDCPDCEAGCTGRTNRFSDSLPEGQRARTEKPPAVSSIFIGGGTPSLLPAAWIAEIMAALRAKFHVMAEAEISIEANPGTTDAEKLSAYRACGINRISFGLQSAQDAELKRLGRIHTFGQFARSYEEARAAGFENINVDLMSAIPGQTEESWLDTLEKTAALGPEHISAYSLILEEGTPFYEKYSAIEDKITAGASAGELFSAERAAGFRPEEMLPDEETERGLYEMTGQVFARHGYEQYEISNYAKPGCACRHNVGYWTGVPYYGFGLGASSYIRFFDNKGAVRFKNSENLSEYLRGDFSKRETVTLQKADEMAEFMILGLRMTRGISEAAFLTRFGCRAEDVYGAQIRKYSRAGLLEKKDGRIFLTREGISLSNMVMSEFLP